VLGTPQYMAPEQARGEPVDKRADVFALGAVLYHLLSGRPPYSGTTASDAIQQVISAEPILVELQPGVPQDLATIVRKAMARDPAERFDSAADFADDLKRFQTGQLVGAHQYSRGLLFRRWLRRNRAAVSVAAALISVLNRI
jgi:serine/threonine protein kinase